MQEWGHHVCMGLLEGILGPQTSSTSPALAEYNKIPVRARETTITKDRVLLLIPEEDGLFFKHRLQSFFT